MAGKVEESFLFMSQGSPYSQPSYKVSDSVPFKWINKKWKEGLFVTSMSTSGGLQPDLSRAGGCKECNGIAGAKAIPGRRRTAGGRGVVDPWRVTFVLGAPASCRR